MEELEGSLCSFQHPTGPLQAPDWAPNGPELVSGQSARRRPVKSERGASSCGKVWWAQMDGVEKEGSRVEKACTRVKKECDRVKKQCSRVKKKCCRVEKKRLGWKKNVLGLKKNVAREGLLRAGSFGLGAWEGIPETAWLVL